MSVVFNQTHQLFLSSSLSSLSLSSLLLFSLNLQWQPISLFNFASPKPNSWSFSVWNHDTRSSLQNPYSFQFIAQIVISITTGQYIPHTAELQLKIFTSINCKIASFVLSMSVPLEELTAQNLVLSLNFLHVLYRSYYLFHYSVLNSNLSKFRYFEYLTLSLLLSLSQSFYL